VYTRCPECGAELEDPGRDFRCPRCGAAVRSMGAEFVADDEGMSPLFSIAASEEPRWKAVLIAVEHLGRLVAVVLFAFSLLLCFGMLLFGVPQVFQNAPGSSYGATLFILAPVPIGLVFLSGYPFLAYYTFIVAALLASMAFLLFSERRQLVAGLVKTVSRLRAPDRHNSASGLVQLPQVFLAVFFFDYVYAIAVLLTGTSPRVPAFGELPDWYLFYTFANASVWEEIAARILLCGLPLLLAYILAYSSSQRPAGLSGSHPQMKTEEAAAPRAAGQPSIPMTLTDYLRGRTTRGLWGYLLGGGFRIGPLEAFFIAGSALMFGLAHVPGWDIWKLLPTFIAGLGFAYLFLRVGIHAAILLHFSFDYLDMTFSAILASSRVPGFDAFYTILVVLWFAVGAFYFWHYIAQGLRWAAGMARRALAPGKGA
jgi:hypothetical protein